MKRLILPLALVLCLLSGCAHTYVITLSNGTRLTADGKPHLERGFYVYKDVKGNKFYIPQGRVREIAPASMVTDETSKFRNTSTK